MALLGMVFDTRLAATHLDSCLGDPSGQPQTSTPSMPAFLLGTQLDMGMVGAMAAVAASNAFLLSFDLPLL